MQLQIKLKFEENTSINAYAYILQSRISIKEFASRWVTAGISVYIHMRKKKKRPTIIKLNAKRFKRDCNVDETLLMNSSQSVDLGQNSTIFG